MDKEEFYVVKIGDMYIKSFKLSTMVNSDDQWKVIREIILINTKKDCMPILKEEAQFLMGLLDGKSAVLEPFEQM